MITRTAIITANSKHAITKTYISASKYILTTAPIGYIIIFSINSLIKDCIRLSAIYIFSIQYIIIYQ